MTLTVPDVVHDSITDACVRMGIRKVGLLFQKAAESCRHGQGFSNNPEVGERWFTLWKQNGFHGLPPACQAFILECNEGQHRESFHGNESERI